MSESTTTTRERNAARGAARDAAGTAVETALGTGMAWWDLMLRMQRASLGSLSVYSPGAGASVTGTVPQERGAAGSAVIQVGEERLNVAARTVLGETVRVRRRVVAQPVEQEVTLREERVVVERRPGPAQAPRGDVLTETVVEMSDSRQVPQVWKSVHVAEEIVLRREVVERTERVRETLRRDVVDLERDREGRPALDVVEHEGGAAEVGAAREQHAEAEAARRRAEALAEAARQAVVPHAAEPAAKPHGAEPRRDEGPRAESRGPAPQPAPAAAPRKG